jgi:nickel-dependent lactate racemase
MQIQLPYGKNSLEINIPGRNLEVLLSLPSMPLPNLDKTLRYTLRKPECSPPLRNILKRGKRVCMIVPDGTRACPTKSILLPLLEELERFKPSEIVILIGNGLHRETPKKEVTELLGEEIVNKCSIVNHRANVENDLTNLNLKTTYETPVIVNSNVIDSDYVFGIGLVEPHFFAGYSGGPKVILPAVAGKESIMNNHGYKMIDDTRATCGILKGNPIHDDIVEFMKLAKLTMIVNVTINSEGEINGVFAGKPISTHSKAVNFLNSYANIELQGLADIVIVSNGGYPLDRNIYQIVKGLATAKRAVKKNGIIIMVAECRDGYGGHEEFKRIVNQAQSPSDILNEIKMNGPFVDQWNAQILARITQEAHIIFVTEKTCQKLLNDRLMDTTNTIQEALEVAKRLHNKRNPKITVIPEGPYIIPNLGN